MRIIAIIPARGGSKRLLKKNIHPFKGKPLLAYTIEACFKSSFINDVYVSSDDVEILNVAEQYGAKSLMRDSELADDLTPKIVAIRSALKQQALLKDGDPDVVIIPQANSPEITNIAIDDGFDLMKKYNLWEVMSADSNGVQNAAFRIVRVDQINNNFLSAHCGFVTFDCLDVHTIEDLNFLEQKF
ncbi:MAG: hypothetical protein P8M12_08920 [Flavobacteriales bacterium]|nr:hypothetical protein [Flavobacteriales bacterium]